MPDDNPDKPRYTVYRSRPKLFKGGREADGLRELRGDDAGERAGNGQRPYTPYRAGGGERRGLRLPFRRRGARPDGAPRPKITVGRVVKWIVLVVIGWLLLSLVLFLVSAQIEQGKVSDAANNALSSSGFTLTSAQNILVLGSDARFKGTAEPGSQIGGPSRSDSIMLLREGGGASSRLSIPRDTVVDIPGHGQNKINAAYAIGGPALAIRTVEDYLGIKVNHLVEVNFEDFPQFIDALGGITVTTGCVKSDINGGKSNGGFSLRLHRGTHHLNGIQALTLARTRENQCNVAENDLTRAKRQQKILAAIKGQITSPGTFFRLPWVAWSAPKAIRTDMGGPSLLGLFGAMEIGGSAKTRILKPSGGVTLPDGGAGLVVSDAERRREVARFLKG